MKSVIKVHDLSKRYRLGRKEKQTETLAGQIGNMIKSPWDNLKRLREMSRFGGEEESIFWALKDINFEVKEGEVLGIIGKNGAGKSTLLKILSQITEPTSGKIEIQGRVASLLEVGTGFHPELSGRENIYMNGTILGMSRKEIDSKLDEIIDFSGVEKFIDTAVKFYSSGMKVRLGFSVAAHLEPEILIIDEVLSVGDYEFQQKCLGKMEQVSKGEGRTILFVSHNMAAVKNLCSQAIILKNGVFQESGNTDSIVKSYLNQQITTLKEREWTKSEFENISVTPIKIRIEYKSEILTVDDSFDINIEFFNKIDQAKLNLSIVLTTQDDIIVFNAISKSKSISLGIIKYSCHVPSNLLNDGIYSIRFLIVKDSKQALIDLSDVLSFEVFDSKRKVDWYGKWIGVVRPDLEWTISN